MALIDLLQDRYVDHMLIGSVLPGEAAKSGGVFAYKPVTEVTLKNGKVIQTTIPCADILSAIQTAGQVPVVSAGGSDLSDDVVSELHELVSQVTKLISHVHFISECIQRQTMGGVNG